MISNGFPNTVRPVCYRLSFLRVDQVGAKEHRATLQRRGGYSSTLSPSDGVYYLATFLARWTSTISSGYGGPSRLSIVNTVTD